MEPTTETIKPLKGAELLEAVRKLGNVSPTDMARACGFITAKGRVQTSKFFKEMLVAKGLLRNRRYRPLRKSQGKAPGYVTTILPNGNLVVNAAYTRQLGLQPSDKVRIEVGRNHIKLTQDESTIIDV